MKAKAEGPSIIGSLAKIGCGGFMALIMVSMLVALGFHGYGASAFMGLFLGLSVAGLISGTAGLGKKKIAIGPFLGVAAVVAIVSTFAGPPIGNSYAKGIEEDKYEELKSAMKSDSFEPERWKYDYFTEVDERHRRPQWEGQYMIARVKRAKIDDVPGELRAVMTEIDEKEDPDKKVKKLFKKARKDARKAFKSYYESAQKVLYADVTGTREFPVDPELRKSFSEILDDLASSSDGNVHVAFVNATELSKPPGTDENLKLMRAQPGLGRSTGKVIKEKQAFSPAYDQQRRDTFMTAMGESFKQVFASEGLLNLVPLGKGDDRDDKIIFEVSSKIIRINTFFTFTNNNIFSGYLFGFEVAWGFKIFNREGKVLYAPNPRRSSPAENLRVASGPSDPDWAMYSVMMDSAYYNYSREMTGRFGLKPPAIKTQFAYTPPKKGKSLR